MMIKHGSLLSRQQRDSVSLFYYPSNISFLVSTSVNSAVIMKYTYGDSIEDANTCLTNYYTDLTTTLLADITNNVPDTVN